MGNLKPWLWALASVLLGVLVWWWRESPPPSRPAILAPALTSAPPSLQAPRLSAPPALAAPTGAGASAQPTDDPFRAFLEGNGRPVVVHPQDNTPALPPGVDPFQAALEASRKNATTAVSPFQSGY